MISCPLCGYEAHESEQLLACSRCPVSGGCRMQRCCRCGYEWAHESQLVKWLTHRWKAFKRMKNDGYPGSH